MIVLDSSFLIAYHNARDLHHEVAVDLMRRVVAGEWGTALLPEHVFLEVVTVVAARRSPAVAVAVGPTLLDAREVELVPCSPYFPTVVEAFGALASKGLSFTDAAIVTIARDRGRCPIATFDRHFAAAGELTLVPGS